MAETPLFEINSPILASAKGKFYKVNPETRASAVSLNGSTLDIEFSRMEDEMEAEAIYTQSERDRIEEEYKASVDSLAADVNESMAALDWYLDTLAAHMADSFSQMGNAMDSLDMAFTDSITATNAGIAALELRAADSLANAEFVIEGQIYDTADSLSASFADSLTATTTTLQANIVSLEGQLTAQFTTAIDSLSASFTTLESGLSAEAATREAADIALGGRIDTLAASITEPDIDLSRATGVLPIANGGTGASSATGNYGAVYNLFPQRIYGPPANFCCLTTGYARTGWMATSDMQSLLGITALQKRYVTETWRDGAAWYTKYNDKWVEQGGRVGPGEANMFVTFPLPFRDTDYSSYVTAWNTARGDRPGAGYNYTTTGFKAVTYGYAVTASWYCCGYGA